MASRLTTPPAIEPASEEATRVAEPSPVRISVAVLAHNAAERILECLEAILNQSRPPDEVILVDNASSDGTAALAAERYPEVVIFRQMENSGCSGGRNQQILQSSHRFVMIVDDDAFLAPNCLQALERNMAERPDASIWAPRICYEQDRERIQFDGGGEWHFICEAVVRNPERLVSECPSELIQARELGFQGGVAFLLDTAAAAELGGYNESYFFGRTDAEFSLRMSMAGNKIVLAPEATVYHRVKPRGLTQVERQIRNRWSLMLQTYSASTLLIISPALVIYEFTLVAFLAGKKHLRAYFSAWRQVFAMLPAIRRQRKVFMIHKRRHDRDALGAGSINMRSDLKSSKVIRLGLAAMNVLFSTYWTLSRLVLLLIPAPATASKSPARVPDDAHESQV